MNTIVLEYIKAWYEEEVSRFEYVESKSGQLLNLLSALIVGFGAIVGLKQEALLSPCTFIDWCVLVLVFATVICLLVSWWFALASLKLGPCPAPSRERENIAYLTLEESDSYKHITDCYLDATELLTPLVNKKAEKLNVSYQSMRLTFVLATVASLIIFLKELFT